MKALAYLVDALLWIAAGVAVTQGNVATFAVTILAGAVVQAAVQDWMNGARPFIKIN